MAHQLLVTLQEGVTDKDAEGMLADLEREFDSSVVVKVERFASADAVPTLKRRDWKYEVANGDTVLGFEEWKQHQAEAVLPSRRRTDDLALGLIEICALLDANEWSPSTLDEVAEVVRRCGLEVRDSG